MITLCNIQKSFAGQQVLKNFSLSIEEGCTQVLLGLSGSGKTTTLKLINGLVTAESGSVKVMGKLLSEHRLEHLRRQMGYVIQQSGLFPHYTVAQNIAVVPKLLKWSGKKIYNRSETILRKLHLDPNLYLPKYPHELSGGEKQRVGLARALASDPPILLMDEPFGALDPITRQGINTEFLNMEELRQKTIVLVTHDVKTAFELGDKIALMQNGRILQNCSPLEMLQKPKGAEVEKFLENDWLSLKLITENKMQAINQTLKNAPQTSWDELYQA